jgi:uncharacterized protein YciI
MKIPVRFAARLVLVVLLFSGFLVAAVARAQQPTPESKAAPVEVGGYEMTTYYVGFLYRGPKWTPEVTPETTRIQEGHMANIHRMAEAGKLLVAGPFSDDGNLRGMYVFQVGSMEEAEKLVQTDPAVQSGRLRFELHPWFAAKNIVVTAHPQPPRGKP